MKLRVITVIEYLYIGVLYIAMGVFELLALSCFGLAALVRLSEDAVRHVNRMIRKAIRTLRELKYCYKIPAMEYLEYVRMGCGETLDSVKGMIREAVRITREMEFCYRIPVMEYMEYIRMECREAWNFRNEIIAAGKA